jgi:hypothetical protein
MVSTGGGGKGAIGITINWETVPRSFALISLSLKLGWLRSQSFLRGRENKSNKRARVTQFQSWRKTGLALFGYSLEVWFVSVNVYLDFSQYRPDSEDHSIKSKSCFL